MKTLLATAIALAISTAAIAADPPAAGKSAYAPTFDPKRLSAEVKTLASDEFEGRGPATPGETKTVAYVIEQMKGAGLSPGGDLKDGKREWTQAVPLLRAEIKGAPKLSLDVGGKVQSLTQGSEIAVRAPLDGAKSVDIAKAPLVFCGYGVTAPERKWDDFKGIDLKGKIAVVLINDPDFETGVGDFGGKAMTYYGRWTYKYEEAARRGAAGLLIVHETDPASYGWATVKNSNTNTMFDVVRDNPSATHPKLEGWIQRDLAVSLLKNAGLDFDKLKKEAQTREFKPVTLKNTTFSASYQVDSSVITSQNIVGRVEGAKHPDETVIYSAHWDHLGVGEPDAKGDKIYNGAVDNATGTAALIELGRAFAQGPKPERSVVFLNVTAEEKGLLGSEYYASKPLYPIAKTVADINMDALDPNGPAKNWSQSGNAQSELLDEAKTFAKAAGLSFTVDPHPEAGHFFRSDHFPFAKRGLPAFSWESGNDLVDGGLEAGEKARKDYVTNRYHQPADEWQASWAFTGMSHDLGVLYQLGNKLANSRQWPNWSADSEFRATRDATANDRK
ncbi:MAG: M28 family peptidase [Rudaea sp.]|uniref:M28 family metallopeptidase n=1 Tax=unclassified Rudaea TaxID=2627037 RepID=UPI0010F45568|nr:MULTISPECIES: M28 family metallopeptidase [unclassified Rudaea]MBN8887884.1 M28 family peptidase [Rudaea sp.]MBR0347434.1 M28 family peptidase [Rudaea sp.]